MILWKFSCHIKFPKFKIIQLYQKIDEISVILFFRSLNLIFYDQLIYQNFIAHVKFSKCTIFQFD